MVSDGRKETLSWATLWTFKSHFLTSHHARREYVQKTLTFVHLILFHLWKASALQKTFSSSSMNTKQYSKFSPNVNFWCGPTPPWIQVFFPQKWYGDLQLAKYILGLLLHLSGFLSTALELGLGLGTVCLDIVNPSFGTMGMKPGCNSRHPPFPCSSRQISRGLLSPQCGNLQIASMSKLADCGCQIWTANQGLDLVYNPMDWQAVQATICQFGSNRQSQACRNAKKQFTGVKKGVSNVCGLPLYVN